MIKIISNNLSQHSILTLSGAKICPDSKIFHKGILQCTDSINRVLGDPNCFEGAEKTIPVTAVITHLGKKKNLPRGTMKKHAQEKFKTICKPPGEEKNYKEMSKIQKIKKNKKTHLMWIKTSYLVS